MSNETMINPINNSNSTVINSELQSNNATVINTEISNLPGKELKYKDAY